MEKVVQGSGTSSFAYSFSYTCLCLLRQTDNVCSSSCNTRTCHHIHTPSGEMWMLLYILKRWLMMIYKNCGKNAKGSWQNKCQDGLSNGQPWKNTWLCFLEPHLHVFLSFSFLDGCDVGTWPLASSVLCPITIRMPLPSLCILWTPPMCECTVESLSTISSCSVLRSSSWFP